MSLPARARPRQRNRWIGQCGLPYPHQMIDLDPRVRDAWGLPAPRMTYDWRRPNELARAEFMMKKIEEIGRAMGATQVWRAPQGSGAPAGHHEGGTRMGNDPKTSVVNRYGQSWDIPESLRRRQLDLPLAKQLQSNAHDPGARLYERRCDRQSLPEEPGIAAVAIRRCPVIAAGLDPQSVAAPAPAGQPVVSSTGLEPHRGHWHRRRPPGTASRSGAGSDKIAIQPRAIPL
jgi:hypothetical protein